jgi:hypothetical protein
MDTYFITFFSCLFLLQGSKLFLSLSSYFSRHVPEVALHVHDLVVAVHGDHGPASPCRFSPYNKYRILSSLPLWSSTSLIWTTMANPSIHSSGKGFGFGFSFWVVYAIGWRMGMGFGRKKGGWLFFPDHWVASLEEAGWVSAARVNAADRRIQFASKQQQ